MEVLRRLAKSSLIVSNAAWVTEIRQSGSTVWMDILKNETWRLQLVVCGIYLCIFFELLCKVVYGGVLCVRDVEPTLSFGDTLLTRFGNKPLFPRFFFFSCVTFP